MNTSEKLPESFEALLRPLQEVYTRNWEVRLTTILQSYLQHLTDDRGMVDFTEAAVILQNSSRVYTRRVDLLEDKINQIINELLTEGGGDDDGTGGTKRRKPGANLRSDDLTELGLIFTNQNIDMKPPQKEKTQEKKSIILNLSAKYKLKQNAFCTVFASDNIELGNKDEFKLHWRISNTGCLQEDFISDIVDNNALNISQVLEETLVNDEPPLEERLSHHMTSDMNSLNPRLDEEPPDPEPMDVDPFDNDDFEDAPAPLSPPPENPPPKRSERKRYRNPKDEKEFWATETSEKNCRRRSVKKGGVIRVPTACRNEKDKSSLEKKKFQFLNHRLMMTVPDKSREYILKKSARMRAGFILQSAAPVAELDEESIPEADDNPPDFDDHIEDDDGGTDFPLPQIVFPEVDTSKVEFPSAHFESGPPTETNLEEPQNDEMNIEDAIRRHYEEMKRAAEEAAELSRRVALWHEKLQPAITKAETQKRFDVQTYSNKIVKCLSNNEGTEAPVPFCKVVKGVPRKEICRYFLSSLMMANTYNVEVVKTSKEKLATDCLEVRLLSTVLQHEKIDDNMKITSQKDNS